MQLDSRVEANASAGLGELQMLAPDVAGAAADRPGGSLDDAALMLRYRDGDVHAFEALYARHKGGVFRYLLRMCRNGDAANDLFQEVWSKVIASRERYEARAQFNTFLYRIAHNCVVDHLRRTARTPLVSDEEASAAALSEAPQTQPETALSAAELRAALRRALDGLPTEQRDVFVLYEESGMGLDEIGRVTGVAMETAKSRLRYAVAKLRAALQPLRDPEEVRR